MIKNILISEENWRYLFLLKNEYNFKSMDDLLTLILIYTKSAIEKEDLEIFNQKKKEKKNE